MRLAKLLLCGAVSALLAISMSPISVNAEAARHAGITNRSKVDEDKSYREAVFRVEAGDSIGSGFAVGPKIVVTCHHVVEQEDGTVMRRAMLVSGIGRHIGATLMSYDKRSDVALLELDEPVGVYFDMAATDVTVGDHVALILSRPEYIAKFVRADVLDLYGDSPCYAGTLTKPVEPGNSGSPMVNADYEVVGIISANIPSQKNRGIYSGPAGLKRLLALRAMIGTATR